MRWNEWDEKGGRKVRGRERKGGVVNGREQEIYARVKEIQLYGHVCIPPALPAEVLISTVTGISLCPVFRTINVTVPSSSFTV